MQCPHCNQEHADNLRTCPNTNLPLARVVLCPNCGREARPGAKFCAGCGQPLPRQTAKLNPNVLNAHPDKAASTPPVPPQPAPEPPLAAKETAQERSEAEPEELPHPVAAEKPPAVETHPSMRVKKEELLIRPAANAPVEPVHRPAVNPMPVTTESAAAWVAIPTSPRHDGVPASQPASRGKLIYIVLGIVILASLAGLFFLFNRPTQPSVPTTPPVALVHTEASPTQQEPVVAPVLTATNTELPASPTPVPPTPEPTATQPPPTKTVSAPAVVTPTLTSPSSAAVGANQVLFVSNRDQNFQAFTINPEKPAEWTPIPLPEEYEVIKWPTFCGERIAYESEDRSMNLPRWVFIYDPASQDIQPIKFADRPTERASLPRCSLDGRYMAVTAMHNGRWYLNAIEIESGKVLFEQPMGSYLQMGFASWSSDPNQFVWMGIKNTGYYDINLTNNLAGGGTLRTLRVAEGKYPALSPDGTRLAYFCGNLSPLCMIEWPSQKTLFQIPISYFKPLDDQMVSATVAWSADGAWVYFSSSISGNWDIYRMRPDGSQVQNLTEGSTADELLPSAH